MGSSIAESMWSTLWSTPRSPQRGPKPAMSRERIVAAGIAIVDADGVEALSMQRLAGDLGFTKMSLYRYVPGRAELLALLVDTALGDPPDLSGVDGGWRVRMRAYAVRLHEAMRRHPWVVEHTTGARVFGPNEMGWLESGLVALAGTGLGGGERLDAVALVVGHVRAIVAQTAGTATPERDIAALVGHVLAEHRDRYPESAAAFAEAAAGDEQDTALEFGLVRILEGLDALIARRG